MGERDPMFLRNGNRVGFTDEDWADRGLNGEIGARAVYFLQQENGELCIPPGLCMRDAR